MFTTSPKMTGDPAATMSVTPNSAMRVAADQRTRLSFLRGEHMQRMRTPVSVTLTVLGLMVLANPTRVIAQDEGDYAAYFALNFTPLGAFVPLPPPASAARGSAFVFRYGNLDLGSGSDGSLHNFAIGGDFSTGRGRLGLTLGGTTCDGCDGNIMAGLDYTATLTQNVVSLPVGAELSGATGPVFTPFLVPGIGYGRLSSDEDSESGMRPMLGGGLAISSRKSTFAAHVGFQKVFIDEGEMAFGLGFSIGRSSP
jgi:hypothetical protein